MVNDQRANQTAKSLKEGKQTNKQQQQKSPVQEQWNFSLCSSGVTPLASRPVCDSCVGLEPSCGG
jgi:hypothetical protein